MPNNPMYVLLVICYLAVSIPFVLADNCRPALELASHNIENVTTLSERQQLYYRKLCRSASSESGTSVSADYLEVVSAAFGQHFASREEFCSIESSKLDENLQIDSKKTTVVNQSVDSWLACERLLKNNSGFWYEPVTRPGVVLIKLQASPTSIVNVRNISVTPAAACRSKGSNNFILQGGKAQSFSCERRATDGSYVPVTLTVKNDIEPFAVYFGPEAVPTMNVACPQSIRIPNQKITLVPGRVDTNTFSWYVHSVAEDENKAARHKDLPLSTFTSLSEGEYVDNVFIKVPRTEYSEVTAFSDTILGDFGTLDGFAGGNNSVLAAKYIKEAQVIAFDFRSITPLTKPVLIDLYVVIKGASCAKQPSTSH